MIAYIYSPGDPSVGLHSKITEVDLLMESDVEPDEKESVRTLLRDCFAEIWDDGGVRVTFGGAVGL